MNTFIFSYLGDSLGNLFESNISMGFSGSTTTFYPASVKWNPPPTPNKTHIFYSYHQYYSLTIPSTNLASVTQFWPIIETCTLFGFFSFLFPIFFSIISSILIWLSCWLQYWYDFQVILSEQPSVFPRLNIWTLFMYDFRPCEPRWCYF